MSKLKLVVVVASVLFAMIGNPITKSYAGDELQYYFIAADGTDDGLRTATSEISLRKCEGGQRLCATGYLDPNHTQPAIILKHQ